MSAKVFGLGCVLLGVLGSVTPGRTGAQDSSPPEPRASMQEPNSEETIPGTGSNGVQTEVDDANLSVWLEQLATRAQGRLVVVSKNGPAENPSESLDANSAAKSASNSGELLLVTLAPLNSEQPIPAESPTEPGQAVLNRSDLPALLLCGDSISHRRLLELLVQPSDDAGRELASGLSVYFVPLLESEIDGTPRPAFAKDFPVGWFPPSLQSDAGEVPFSRPDSALIRDTLQQHPNILLLLGNKSVGEQAWPRLDAPLTKDPQLSGGSLAAYAWYTFGIPSRTLEPAPDQSLGSYLCDELPRIAGSIQAVESLGPGQWRVDLELHNLGRWQSFSKLGQQLTGLKSLVLDLRGGQVVAAASALGDEPFRLEEGRDLATSWRLRMPPLPGLTQRRLRLIVEAEPDSELDLKVDNAWTAPLNLKVELKEPK